MAHPGRADRPEVRMPSAAQSGGFPARGSTIAIAISAETRPGMNSLKGDPGTLIPDRIASKIIKHRRHPMKTAGSAPGPVARAGTLPTSDAPTRRDATPLHPGPTPTHGGNRTFLCAVGGRAPAGPGCGGRDEHARGLRAPPPRAPRARRGGRRGVRLLVRRDPGALTHRSSGETEPPAPP